MDKSALQAELDQLRGAKASILAGGKIAEVRRPNGWLIRYAAADLDAINLRIREIESLLQVSGRRRAMGVSL